MSSIKYLERATRLLQNLLGSDEAEAVLGDIEELGPEKGHMWMFWQVLRAVGSQFQVAVQWQGALFVNHARLTFRRLARHKGYSAITIGGLALGIAASSLMALWIWDELGYDHFYKYADRLFRVEQLMKTQDGRNPIAITPSPLGPVLESTFPEIESTARLIYLSQYSLAAGDKCFLENRLMAADSTFLRLFQFKVIYGDGLKGLQKPNAVVLTRKIAEKYFGDSDPVGKTLLISKSNRLEVTAVIEDHPHNTHLDFEILVTLDMARKLGCEFFPDRWHRFDDVHTYALLRPGVDPMALGEKIKDIKKDYQQEDWDDAITLRPVTGIRHAPHVEYNLAPTVNLDDLNIYAVMAVMVLLIACMNHINLSTARATLREREMGMRRALGATRRNLTLQMLHESLLMGALALLMANGATGLSGGILKVLWGKSVAMGSWFFSSWWWLLNAGFLIVVLATGLYPALLIASYGTGGRLKVRSSSAALRKTLVVLQFVLVVLLLSGTLLVNHQMNFMRNKDVGFERDLVIAANLNIAEEKQLWDGGFEALKTELTRDSRILDASTACQSPADMGVSAGACWWEGKTDNQELLVRWNSVDYRYIETLGLEVLMGRSFSEEHNDILKDMVNARFIVNEAAARGMGVVNPVGLQFELYGKKGPIVGVVKDFHYRSMREQVDPMAMFVAPFWNETLLIRFSGTDLDGGLEYVESVWKKFLPESPFSWRFLRDEYKWMYEADERMRWIVSGLSLLVVVIAAVGLLGMVSFSVQVRTKEIGIRKVLGGSVYSVVRLLTWDAMKPIVLATLLALPLAWWLLSGWLQQFACRVNLNWALLMAAALSAWLAALGTLMLQTVKAALASPVSSLRDE